MNEINLKELVDGALNEKFNKSFEKVVDNLQDVNTPYKSKRGITISLSFEQNEARDDVKVTVGVTEKLAAQTSLSTSFQVGKDLKTGKTYAHEYGKQLKGQIKMDDDAPKEVKNDSVVDFRKVK